MRIGVINDVGVVALGLSGLIERSGDAVAWIARDGEDGLRRCREDTPELILMDLHMPVMDGVECTRRIMAECPCPILIVTSSVAGSLDMVYRAMSHGALDAVDTPDGVGGIGDRALLRKIATLRKLSGPVNAPSGVLKPISARPQPARPPLIVIGASTGGPAAVAEVMRAFDPSVAVVVVQHVDVHFAPGLASWLTHESRFPTELATLGSRPRAGVALLAASEDHVIFDRDGAVVFTKDPADYPYRPSVDVFFRSVSAHWPVRGAAALLTGMGKDGAAGLLLLKQRGWTTFAQDAATSVVHGMPKAAAELGAATRVLPLHEIGPALAHAVSKARPVR